MPKTDQHLSAAKRALDRLRAGIGPCDSADVLILSAQIARDLQLAAGPPPEDLGGLNEEISSLTARSHRLNAESILDYLRHNDDRVKAEIWVAKLRVALICAGGLSPENLGASEAELNRFITDPELDTRLARAEFALDRLRGGGGGGSYRFVQLMLDDLRWELGTSEKFSLADLGLTEEGLTEIVTAALLARARFILDRLGNHTGPIAVVFWIRELRETLTAGNLSLESIGASEAMLYHFRSIGNGVTMI